MVWSDLRLCNTITTCLIWYDMICFWMWLFFCFTNLPMYNTKQALEKQMPAFPCPYEVMFTNKKHALSCRGQEGGGLKKLQMKCKTVYTTTVPQPASCWSSRTRGASNSIGNRTPQTTHGPMDPWRIHLTTHGLTLPMNSHNFAHVRVCTLQKCPISVWPATGRVQPCANSDLVSIDISTSALNSNVYIIWTGNTTHLCPFSKRRSSTPTTPTPPHALALQPQRHLVWIWAASRETSSAPTVPPQALSLQPQRHDLAARWAAASGDARARRRSPLLLCNNINSLICVV